MVLVRSDEGQVANDKYDHAQVLDEFDLCHFLMKHSHEALSLSAEFIESILLLLFDVDRFAAARFVQVLNSIFIFLAEETPLSSLLLVEFKVSFFLLSSKESVRFVVQNVQLRLFFFVLGLESVDKTRHV